MIKLCVACLPCNREGCTRCCVCRRPIRVTYEPDEVRRLILLEREECAVLAESEDPADMNNPGDRIRERGDPFDLI